MVEESKFFFSISCVLGGFGEDLRWKLYLAEDFQNFQGFSRLTSISFEGEILMVLGLL